MMITMNLSTSSAPLFQCPGNCFGCEWARHTYLEGRPMVVFCGLPVDLGDGWYQIPIPYDINFNEKAMMIAAIEQILQDSIDNCDPRDIAERIYNLMRK